MSVLYSNPRCAKVLRRTQKAFRDGGSIVVALPSDWIRNNGLSPGDEVLIAYDRDKVTVRVAAEVSR